jgi:hypothetical protein
VSDFAVDAIPEFLSVIGARELFSRNGHIEKCTKWFPTVLYFENK